MEIPISADDALAACHALDLDEFPPVVSWLVAAIHEGARAGDADPIRFLLDGLGVADLKELRQLVELGRPREAEEELIPWVGTICIEGVQTTDGRLILPGAVRWPNLPVPLNDPAGRNIGSVDSVWRYGSCIRAAGKAAAYSGPCLAMEVSIERYSIADDTTVVEEANLRAVAATMETVAWPEARMDSEE